MGSDAGSIPPELMAPAQALIGLAGLDARNNATHRAIWDAFSSNRLPDRPPIQYKLLPNDYEFPICKPKRTSYEWYLPKGILKRNWLPKHLNALPALVIVFFELNWNDPQWAERKLECAAALQSMRAALQGRNTRLGLALIQSVSPAPSLDDGQNSEKATALCATCDITAKMLFILPLNDHLNGYAQRLESAFLELSHSYYQQMARVIRSHKDQLTTAHQGLKTRHQFKLAVLSELRQDPNIAHKHYTQAYLTLDEIRIIDNNCLEIKTVAGYINYKLCRTMFQLNLPRDAISQFKSHIDRYKTRIGCRELEFEHYSWLSAQYYAFAELFNEAVDKGLPAIQTQHPGYYYQDAAKHSILRQKSIAQFLPNISKELQSPSAIAFSEFYGVRVSSGPGEPSTEQQIIATIQKQETMFDHSTVIINLLGLASSQFKNYRCTRMRRRIFVQMAEQYLMCNETGKALTLFMHMLSDYRTEGVLHLWKYVHTRALYASCMTVSIPDYVHLVLEALSTKLNKDAAEQSRISSNLERILQSLPPESEPTLQLEHASKPLPLMYTKTVETWLQSLATPQTITVDMATIAPCFQIYATFNSAEISIDDEIVIQVLIRSLSHVLLSFSKICLSIKCKDQTIDIEPSEEYPNTDGHILAPNGSKLFAFKTKCELFSEGSELQISKALVQMGGSHMILLISVPITEVSNVHSYTLETDSTLQKLLSENKITDIISTSTIVPRPSNLFCEAVHDTPALKGEWHKISLNLQNKEADDIHDVTTSLMVQDQITNVGLCLMPTIDTVHNNASLNITLKEIKQNAKFIQTFFVKSEQINNVKISIKFIYKIGNSDEHEANHVSTKDHIVVFSIVEPFSVTSQYLSSSFKEINYCYEDSKFIVLTCLSVKSPWPLIIEDTYIEPAKPILTQCNGPTSQLKDVKIQTNEQGTEVFGVQSIENVSSSFDVVPKNADISSVGTYNILWKREGALYTNKCTITLPGIIMKMCSLRVEVILPAQGIVRTSLPLRYVLHNKCDSLVNLRAVLDSSESFMFSGHKEMQLTLLPFDEIPLSFNLFPLVCGYVTLPRLILTAETSDTVISSHDIPTHIFILPQKKMMKPTIYEIEADIPKLEIA